MMQLLFLLIFCEGIYRFWEILSSEDTWNLHCVLCLWTAVLGLIGAWMLGMREVDLQDQMHGEFVGGGEKGCKF